VIQKPPFDFGPFGISERRIIAPPIGLYIPPGVRLYADAATRLNWRPMSGNAVSGYPDMGMREVVVWWRGMPIVMEPKPPAAFSNPTESRFRLDIADNLLGSTGGMLATAMAVSTLYYIYVNPDGVLKASATAPSYSYDGVRVLNTTLGARAWLFLGYIRTSAAGNFTDTTTDRLVVNWFNRLRKSILLRPGYVNDDAITTYTHSSTVYAEVNAGTGATGSYIATGEDSVSFAAHYIALPGAAATMRCGIGDNSLTNADVSGMSEVSATVNDTSVQLIITPAEGYRTVSLLAVRLVANGTFRADLNRLGSATDPAITYLTGEVVT